MKIKTFSVIAPMQFQLSEDLKVFVKLKNTDLKEKHDIYQIFSQ